ncbi:MAG: GyrI-like domain-containing protein [Ignavibacteriae bacterium]|nr:GyrI-like domain-containing protein [Ignavibacteriota bacterium]
MDKIDFKKTLKNLYNAKLTEEIIDVPEMLFLTIDGKGNPNTSEDYKNAVEALFSLSYTIKFMIKKNQQIDYGVMPLEGLWWVDDMKNFSIDRKDEWKWKAMIMQPEFVSSKIVQKGIEEVKKKKDLSAINKIKFAKFCEGKSAQVLHVGPFSEEGTTIIKLHKFIEENGYKLSGKHREIYLSDIRKATPEKWKTIIRQPFE